MGHRSGTSLKEQGLFYFIQSVFPDAINRYLIPSSDKPLEVDIFIPELNVAIEYDGRYWHKDKTDADNQKTQKLNALGVKVIRIREHGLPDLNDFDGIVISVSGHGLNGTSFDYINFTLDYLASIVDDEKKQQIKSIRADETTYKHAEKHIYANRYFDAVEPNLSDMCGIEFWAANQNYPLDITHVHQFDWVPAILVCPNRREINLPRYHREFKSNCSKHGSSCQQCSYGIMCPLIKFCARNGEKKISCEYVEKKVWTMIEEGKSIVDYEASGTFKRWLRSESDIGEKMIRKFNSCHPKSKEREAIVHFLGFNVDYYRKLAAKDEFDIYSIF